MEQSEIKNVQEKLNTAVKLAKAENVGEFLTVYDQLGAMMSTSTHTFSNSFNTINAMSASKLAFIKSQTVSVLGVLGFLLGLIYLASTLSNGGSSILVTGIYIISGVSLAIYLKVKIGELWDVFKSYWVINKQETYLIHSLAYNIQVANLLKPFIIYVESELLPDWEKRGIYTPKKEENPMDAFFKGFSSSTPDTEKVENVEDK